MNRETDAAIETDVLIIGAGPCGLFQVFELGLLDIRAHVVDSMPHVGGQCSELYPDKPIYDIPAYPVIGAQELVDRLMEQIEPFDPQFHLGHEVRSLERQPDGRFLATTSRDQSFLAKAIIIAGGVGSFQPRKLRLAGAEALEGIQIHYKIKDPNRFSGRRVAVLGGGDSALDWALELHERVAEMTVVHRRAEYRAQPASVSKLEALAEAGKLSIRQANLTGLHLEEGTLTGIDLMAADRSVERLDLDDLLIFWGLSPKLGPIAQWGLGMEKNQLEVDTAAFQTSEPGIYAVGDINTYPGKKKLILSGFHEAALAAFAIRHQLYPEEKLRLQYTTTSPVMHERLGVKG
ncbi:MAG: NAD(P)/FAD-dependent oxidoreductase [Xanthomonadales bacterium]|nr:NAD(P)/FAD-dependent oxidoreductase [Xanthomonadales bacterium]